MLIPSSYVGKRKKKHASMHLSRIFEHHQDTQERARYHQMSQEAHLQECRPVKLEDYIKNVNLFWCSPLTHIGAYYSNIVPA